MGNTSGTPAAAGAGPSLADEQRQVARDRIIGAAQMVLVGEGLDATVDQIAETAGVSRRTIFRHFGTREHLLALAIRGGMALYQEHFPELDPAEDLHAWLTAVLEVSHRINSLNGRAYWDLMLPGRTFTGELAEVAEERLAIRLESTTAITATVWTHSGGEGTPPEWLADTIAIHLSGFTTEALRGDFGRTPEQVADLSVRVIEAAVTAALSTPQEPT